MMRSKRSRLARPEVPALATVLSLLCAACVWGQARQVQQVRLIDQTPFDQITLKEGPLDKRVFKIFPLRGGKRRPIREQEPEFRFLVRLFKQPDLHYRIAWKHIAKLELFEEMVLTTAKTLTEGKQFDEAYEYYHFLQKWSPDFPGVEEDFQNCLFQEGMHLFEQGQYAQTLLRLNEVYRLNNRFKNLHTSLDLVVDKLVDQHISAGRAAAARELLDELELKSPQSKVLPQKRLMLQERAAASYKLALAAHAARQFREAHQRTRETLAWWPGHEDASTLRGELHRSYPLVEIGVRQFGPVIADERFPGWQSIRINRLLSRQVAELIGFDDNGGQYASPYGKWNAAANRFTFTAHSGRPWTQLKLNPHDIANYFLALNNAPTDHGRRWHRLLSNVATEREAVVFQLRTAHPKPEAYWRTSLAPRNSAATGAVAAPYTANRQVDEVRFVLNHKYFAATPSQPREIIERRVTTPQGGVRALLSSDILALDRVFPWEQSKFEKHDQLRLKPYATPTVQFLVPHPRNAWLAHWEMRRAIIAGINRLRILRREFDIPEGNPMGQVLTGLFAPQLIGADQVPSPYAYEPRLMMGLARLVQKRLGEPSLPTLRIAYRPGELAKRSCRGIQAQLSLDGKGIHIELVELAPDRPADEQSWDLLYVAYPAMEPLSDASRVLLGTRGNTIRSAGGRSRLRRAISELDQSGDHDDLKRQLVKINQLVHDQLTVIPLWQTTEHFVHHVRLQQIGKHPVTLYQNVEQWQLALERP